MVISVSFEAPITAYFWVETCYVTATLYEHTYIHVCMLLIMYTLLEIFFWAELACGEKVAILRFCWHW